MRSVQRDKRLALATFHDTYDLRRKLFAEHQRKLRDARQQAAKQQDAAIAISSSMAELMASSAVACDIEVHND